MMRILTTILSLAGALIAVLLLVGPASAETVQVQVESRIDAKSAIGLLISSHGAIQKPNTKINQGTADVQVVTFDFARDEVAEDTVATAILTGENGEVAFGDVRPVIPGGINTSWALLPACEPQPDSRLSVNGQLGLLQSLVGIRAARRQVNQLRVEKVLQGPFLEKLKRLEKGFGLTQPSELDPHLSAFQLADRLSRLANAIRNYNQSKLESKKSDKKSQQQ